MGTASQERLPRVRPDGPNQDAADIVGLAAGLRLVATRLARRLRQRADTGITPSMLSALASIEERGPLTLKDLAAVEQVQPPSMTSIAARLEDAGLVSREVDPQDRRSARIRMTSQGRQMLERSRSRKTAYLARRLRSLEQGDHAVLREAVRILERLLGEDE